MKQINYSTIVKKYIKIFLVLCFIVLELSAFRADYVTLDKETNDKITENELDSNYMLETKNRVSISNLDLPVSKTANTAFNSILLKEHIISQMNGVLNEIRPFSSTAKTIRTSKLSDEDILLIAACVQMEAGVSSYEGQVAVTNVILNRLESGRWGNTITDVIYAKNQFPGASNGKLTRILENGVNEKIFTAIDDAMLGYNNIGKFMFFNAASAVNLDKYESAVIIGGNCFYN